MALLKRKQRRKCYFGCEFKGPLHSFPLSNYDNRFNEWKSILGEDVKSKGDDYIYRNVLLCRRHFEGYYHTSSNRLTADSIPTLNLRKEDNIMHVGIENSQTINETNLLLKNFNRNFPSKWDKNLQSVIEENLRLKRELNVTQSRICNLEKEVKRNNIMLHGVNEVEKNQKELIEMILDILNKAGKAGGLELYKKWEISDAYRIGKEDDNIKRPIIVKLTLSWRKNEILANNSNFSGKVFATEDFLEEV